MSQDEHYKLVSRLKPGKIVLPILIGLGVVAWFIIREIDTDALGQLNFTWRALFWLLIAWCCMIGRDLGYIIRIRILSENDLTWRQAFRVIMLWEFTSAITPSTVGGTAVAVVFIHKEGISVGRSTSIVLATSFLDELYFVIMFPLNSADCGRRYPFHDLTAGNRDSPSEQPCVCRSGRIPDNSGMGPAGRLWAFC